MAELIQYQMLIDGEFVDASDGARFDSCNPTSGDVWCQVPSATAEDVDRAVRAAHRAFSQGPWSTMTASERGRCLRR
ncbi:MAG: aldehyde dehydrogenase family protein, partial [Pseudomonadota bacterium]